MTPQKWMELAQANSPELRLLARLYASREIGPLIVSLESGDHKAAYGSLRLVWYNVPIDNNLTENLPGWDVLHTLCTNYGGEK